MKWATNEFHVLIFNEYSFMTNYRMVKNFGGKKVWQKGCFARIGEKNFGEC